MIKNEIPFTWRLAFSATFALFWRWLLIAAVPGILLLGFLATSPLGPLVQSSLSFFALWLAVKWLLGSGRLASMKLMFMEQAHYQELVSNIVVERDAPQTARPSP